MKLAALARRLKLIRSNKKIVVVGGAFDLLHDGHVEFLERSKKFGDILIVVITSDSYTRERKGPTRPIVTEHLRVRMLAALRCVDFATVSDYSAYSDEVLTMIKPDVIVFALEGGVNEHRKIYKKKFEQKFPFMTVKFVDTKSRTSTTNILKKIASQI
jgi:rfaE bifunctional protein nucleotidyltransferase chain/domain